MYIKNINIMKLLTHDMYMGTRYIHSIHVWILFQFSQIKLQADIIILVNIEYNANNMCIFYFLHCNKQVIVLFISGFYEDRYGDVMLWAYCVRTCMQQLRLFATGDMCSLWFSCSSSAMMHVLSTMSWYVSSPSEFNTNVWIGDMTKRYTISFCIALWGLYMLESYMGASWPTFLWFSLCVHFESVFCDTRVHCPLFALSCSDIYMYIYVYTLWHYENVIGMVLQIYTW